MNYCDLLLNLIKDDIEEDSLLDNRYQLIISNIEKCINDVNLIKELLPLSVDFIQDEKINNLINSIYRASKYIGNERVVNEIKTNLSACKQLILSHYEIVRNRLIKTNLILEAFENNNNSEVLFDYIQKMYENKKISIEEAINLNAFIAIRNRKEIMTDVLPTELDNNKTTTISENSNPEDIEQELIALFNKYGYPYNDEVLGIDERNRLKKYGKIDKTDKALAFFKKFGIQAEDFNDNTIKTIVNIILFFDEQVIQEISNFIENNKCTLLALFDFSSIFFRKKRKNKIRKSSGEIIDESKEDNDRNKDSCIPPSGSYEDFFYNLELLRKSKRIELDEDGKITNKSFIERSDGMGFRTFLQTPSELIIHNLNIMRKYEIINGENELPKSLLSACGSDIEFVIDRFVEAGLFDVLKESQSYLYIYPKSKFRWYKIQLAITLQDNIKPKQGGGIRKVLTNSKMVYHNMSTKKINNEEIINQDNVMNDFALSALEYYSRSITSADINLLKNEDENTRKERLFNAYFKMSTKKIMSIYEDVSDTKNKNKMKNLSIPVINTFAYDYNNYTFDENELLSDSYIEMLERFKIDNNQYVIYDEKRPKYIIIISRHKVLRLCSMLKTNNAWITDDMSIEQKNALILSVLLKDKIITRHDYHLIKKTVKNMVDTLNKNNRNNYGKGREL